MQPKRMMSANVQHTLDDFAQKVEPAVLAIMNKRGRAYPLTVEMAQFVAAIRNHGQQRSTGIKFSDPDLYWKDFYMDAGESDRITRELYDSGDLRTTVEE
jgi:hypothetical protein